MVDMSIIERILPKQVFLRFMAELARLKSINTKREKAFLAAVNKTTPVAHS